MRKVQLLLLLLLCVGGVSAQSRTVTHDEQNQTVTITRTLPKRVDKHDIRVGVGTLSMTSMMLLDGSMFGGCDCYYPSFRESMATADTYLTDQYHIGTYSLSYTYHSRRWFQYGATLTFSSLVRSRKSSIDNRRVENLNSYAGGIMATFRFVYLYREKVQLYSTIQPGVIIGRDDTVPWVDLTLIGCTFGSRLFGFAELGAGFSGWVRVGIGYRFNSGKSKR